MYRFCLVKNTNQIINKNPPNITTCISSNNNDNKIILGTQFNCIKNENKINVILSRYYMVKILS